MNGEIAIQQVTKVRTPCKCKPQCRIYHRVNGFDIYCNTHLRDLALRILDIVGEGADAPAPKGWTAEQDDILINWVSKGRKSGDQQKIAELVGKHRESVRRRVIKLREEGRIN